MLVYHPGARSFFEREEDAPEPVKVKRFFVSLAWADGHLATDLLSYEDLQEAIKRRDALFERYQNGYDSGCGWVETRLTICQVGVRTVNTIFRYRER